MLSPLRQLLATAATSTAAPALLRARAVPLALSPAASSYLLHRASFATTARAMSDGDLGAPPRGGGQGDAFQRRERASEDMAIRRREKEKLLEIRDRIRKQRSQLDNMEKHLEDLNDKLLDDKENEHAGEHEETGKGQSQPKK